MKDAPTIPHQNLRAAQEPSRFAGRIEQWLYLNGAGLSVAGGDVTMIRPGKNGVIDIEYRFDLGGAGTANAVATTKAKRIAEGC